MQGQFSEQLTGCSHELPPLMFQFSAPAIHESPLCSCGKIAVIAEVHGLGKPLGYQEFQGGNGTVEECGELRHLFTGKVAQYIIGGISVQGPAYSNPNPLEAAAQLLHERAEAVMPPMAASFLQFEPPEGKIEVIMNDDEVVKVDFVEAQRFSRRSS